MKMQFVVNEHDVRPLCVPPHSRQWIALPVSADHQQILRIRAEVSLCDVQGFWHSLLYRPRMQLDWDIQFQSAANHGFPWITFFNTSHHNRCSLGLSDLVTDVEVSCHLDQTNHAYQVEFSFRATPNLKLWVDTTDQPWPASLAGYRESLTDSRSRSYPDASWYPVYCTWYARHRDFDAKWLEAAAPIIHQLGFRTVVLDDGWSCSDRSTVTPQTLGNWYAPIGDWRPDKSKFSDFAGHVQKIRAMGLRYMVWVAPLMLGTESVFGRSRLKNQTPKTGFFNADPTDHADVEQILANMSNLMAQTHLDGLKVDFLDDLKPSLAHPVGQSMNQLMSRLSASIRASNPHAMIEYRQHYTGIGSLGLATNFRCNDVPYDFVENLHRLAQLRITLGDGVPIHADPVFWHPSESDLGISRHLIAALAGVPMLSMDPITLPERSLQLIDHWIHVYHRHLPTFRNGRWSIKYRFDQVTAICAETDEECIAMIYDQSAWPEIAERYETKPYCVINGSGEPLLFSQKQTVRDMYNKIKASQVLPPGSHTESETYPADEATSKSIQICSLKMINAKP